MIKQILAKTRELKRLLDKPNLDPIDIMASTRRYFGEEFLETDIPTYYRNELKKYKPNKNYGDFKETE